jgi:hypothetical protein
VEAHEKVTADALSAIFRLDTTAAIVPAAALQIATTALGRTSGIRPKNEQTIKPPATESATSILGYGEPPGPLLSPLPLAPTMPCASLGPASGVPFVVASVVTGVISHINEKRRECPPSIVQKIV